MGYYTRFDLELHEATEEYPNVVSVYNAFQEMQETGEADFEFEGFDYAFDQNGYSNDSLKWYENDAEMSAFSELFPEVTFLLKGEGEDNQDIWHKYFKNGRSVLKTAKIVIEPLREGEL